MAKGKKKKRQAVKRTYKDSIFRSLFNNENALRELYSALSGQSISTGEAIEIVTLEDAIHNNRKNDLAFTVNSKMVVLIEQQSTDSPNLPIRMFIYLAELYDRMLDERVYRTTRVTIPTPELYVFYNGKAERQEEWEQRLSDLFESVKETMNVEVIVKVININYEKGAELLNKCKTLKGYSFLLHKVQQLLNQGVTLDEALPQAIRECIEEDVIADFLRKNGGKTMSILRQVWTEEQKREMYREEFQAEAHRADALEMKADGMPIEKIMQYTKLPREVIEAL